MRESNILQIPEEICSVIPFPRDLVLNTEFLRCINRLLANKASILSKLLQQAKHDRFSKPIKGSPIRHAKLLTFSIAASPTMRTCSAVLVFAFLAFADQSILATLCTIPVLCCSRVLLLTT